MPHKRNYNQGDRDHSNNPGANKGSADDKPGDGRRNGSESGGGRNGGQDSSSGSSGHQSGGSGSHKD